MPSTTAILSAYTTLAALAMLVRTVLNEVQNMINQLIPKALQEKILSKLGGLILMGSLSPNVTLVVDEYKGLSINEIFEASEIYLRTKITPSIERLKVSKVPREKNLSVTINKGEKIIDVFEGIQLIWEVICIEDQKTSFDYEGYFSNEKVERKSIELSFNRKHKEIVLNSYLPYVLERSKAIKAENKAVKLFSLGSFSGDYEGGPWGSVNLDHPSTFETLAMDSTLKEELIDDLDRFVRRREFYRRVGKAWKRGYLLYGPPGTGKSSLIAAMANYLKFHIYDLELTCLTSNSELKRLMVSTANRSIIVIEDIDCSVELENRGVGGYNQSDNQLTLSGLLNFIDGLWSSCGDERIVVFTTNHKERLDPALLRPGRMDMHIHMSYCTPCGFKTLALNYLGICNHILFSEIGMLLSDVEITPAEIAEELMKSEEADIALARLVEFLQKKKKAKDGESKFEGGNEVDEEGTKSEETNEGGEKKANRKKRKAERRKCFLQQKTRR
ncbi:unnamed protein product [Ilex paraguariensis]|uniref:AAA+ ATPase domain-containing protein n=1 Tax=Ilex paraguariensis TaxID=185542 RepID=A0ABC8QX40_9AQUA